MSVKQLSIFVENKFGRLDAIVDALGKNGINIRALSLADTTDFGILRLIASEPDRAKEVLSDIGVISKCTPVTAVFLKDSAGGLAEVLKVFTKNEISIDYMYAFLGRKAGEAMMVLKTDDIEKTEKALISADIKMATEEDINE